NKTVVEFVQPRQMQDGRILALERQYTDVDDGGNLVIIDGTHFVENTQRLLGNAGLAGPAQTPATPDDVLTIPGPSPGGRFSSAYPLQDGTSRILQRIGGAEASAACSTPRRLRRRSCRAPPRRSLPRTPRLRRRCTACGCSIRRRTPSCPSCHRPRA